MVYYGYMVKQKQQVHLHQNEADIVCLEFAELNLLAVPELLGLAEVGDLQPEVIILEKIYLKMIKGQI